MGMPLAVKFAAYVTVSLPRTLLAQVFEFSTAVMQLIFSVNFWRMAHQVSAPHLDVLCVCLTRNHRSQEINPFFQRTV